MSIRREEIDIKTADGVAHAWTYRAGEGSRPAVLLYPDKGGVRPATHEMAERLVGLGYFVLQPNIFYRAGNYRPFDPATVWNDPGRRGPAADPQVADPAGP